MSLLMGISMMVNFKMEIVKDKGAIHGQIIAIIKVNGWLTRWMAKEYMQIPKYSLKVISKMIISYDHYNDSDKFIIC
jgi:hypothetical protein